MTLYKNILKICNELSNLFESDYNVSNKVKYNLLENGKHIVANDFSLGLKKAILFKNEYKKDITKAILGISDIEFEIVFKQLNSIIHLGGGRWMFLDRYNLPIKEYRLHSNAIKMISKLTGLKIARHNGTDVLSHNDLITDAQKITINNVYKGKPCEPEMMKHLNDFFNKSGITEPTLPNRL